MATWSEVRARLAVVLARVEGANGDPLKVVTHPAESPPSVLPAVVLGEPSAELAEGESRRGLDRWEAPLLVLVPSADYTIGAALLDEYLARSGPKSIRQALADDAGLGLQDGTRAFLDRVNEYGPREPGMAGAVLTLVVRTAG